MRKIRTRNGMQDYLDVKWRLAWLRAEQPTAQVVTEQIEGDEQHARFKCVILLANGATATGHGSETVQDFPDFYEKAETKAIGRACAVLGYGTDAASDLDDGEPLDGYASSQQARRERREEEPGDEPPRAPAEPRRQHSPDPDGPAVQGQVVAMKQLERNGVGIAAKAKERFGKELAALTFTEAAAIIKDAQARK